MQNFITNFGGYIGVASAVIFGAFGLFGIFNKNARAMKKEGIDTAKDVIDLLNAKVAALEAKMDEYQETVDELTKKVDSLQAENHTLTQVLQGRDGQTQQFYKDMYASMEVMKNIAISSADNSKTLTKLMATLDGFMKAKA